MGKSGSAFFILFFVLTLRTWADLNENNNELEKSLSFVKSVLASREWEPADSMVYKRLVALVNYVENPSADSLILQIGTDAVNNRITFVRELKKMRDGEALKGYITDEVVRKNIENIQNDVRRHISEQTIVVPESLFVGMYAGLPLIPRGDIQKMIDESLVKIPDRLAEIFSDSGQDRAYVDSLKSHFLDSARIAYNNRIIEQFRDSVSRQFRENFYKNHADSMIDVYLSAVKRSNQRFLSSYNDIKTKELNEQFSMAITQLLEYANGIPNELTIVDSKNNFTKLYLQNNEPWYTWMWLKNLQNDSIGIRIEGLGRQSVKMMVDESVNLSRMTRKQTVDVSKLVPQMKEKATLTKVNLPKPIHVPWSLGGTAYTGFSETYINDYWAKGGSTSASILSTFKYYANYSKEKIKWDNNLDAKLGLIYYLPDQSNQSDDPERNLHKNSDNLDISSKLGVSAFKNWYYSAEMVFKSQFFDGYKNRTDTIPSSSILSPAYINFSVGLDFNPKGKNFSLFLSPISLKTIIVTNPEVNRSTYGLANGHNVKTQMGSYMKLEHNRKITSDISVITKNTFFVNFSRNEKDEPLWTKFPDLDSETTLNFKVNQFVTTTINAHFIYDKNIKSEWTRNGVKETGTRLQIKEFLTLGFTYRL